jgi:hypothetical protein
MRHRKIGSGFDPNHVKFIVLAGRTYMPCIMTECPCTDLCVYSVLFSQSTGIDPPYSQNHWKVLQ